MRLQRVSIAGLLGIILIVALGLALLRTANEATAAAAYSCAVLAVLVAAMGGLFAVKETRAFCAGFAAFAATYLALIFGPWSSAMQLRYTAYQSSRPQVEPPAAITSVYWLEQLNAAQMRSRGYEVGAKVDVLWGNSYWPSTIVEMKDDRYKIHYDNHDPSSDEWITINRLGRWGQNRQHFHQVGHSIFALLLGMMGGGVAVAFLRSRPQEATP